MYTTFRFEGMEIWNRRGWKSAYRRRKFGRRITFRPWSILIALGVAGALLPVSLFT